jgi:hypothetical protein
MGTFLSPVGQVLRTAARVISLEISESIGLDSFRAVSSYVCIPSGKAKD